MLWVSAVGVLGLVQALLLLLFAWEHRRYHLRRRRAPADDGPQPAVRLVVPCRGVDPQMHENLRALFELDYRQLELCFAVESHRDQAVKVIHDLRHEFPSRICEIVVAGVARDCGQKVHNLMAATRLERGECEILAFVDSDARPHRDWLARLVGRLDSGKHAIATGYRWYAPADSGWANRLLSAINNTVVGVMGPHGFNLVWGGAWAIRAETFDQLGLPEAWNGSLSDDLIVSRLLRASELSLAYEPHALVISPATFTFASAAEFLRRQFLVVRNYAPQWWHFGFWSGLASLTVFWGLAVTTAVIAASHGRWWIPASFLVGIYLLGACRWSWCMSSIRPFVRVPDALFSAVGRVNVWAWPVVSLAVWLAMASAAVGKTIVWRGIHYSMDAPNRTRVLNRGDEPPVIPPDCPASTRRAAA